MSKNLRLVKYVKFECVQTVRKHIKKRVPKNKILFCVLYGSLHSLGNAENAVCRNFHTVALQPTPHENFSCQFKISISVMARPHGQPSDWPLNVQFWYVQALC